MKNNILKSIGAILVGFLSVALLSVATDYVLEFTGILPPQSDKQLFTNWVLVLTFLYRIAYTLLGGYITAKLSPINIMGNVKILGLISTIGAFISIFLGWNLSYHWYPIALTVTAFPLTWLGGIIRERYRVRN